MMLMAQTRTLSDVGWGEWEKNQTQGLGESTKRKEERRETSVRVSAIRQKHYGGAAPRRVGAAPAVSITCSVLFDTTSRTGGRSTGLRLAPHMGIAPLRGSLRAAPMF